MLNDVYYLHTNITSGGYFAGASYNVSEIIGGYFASSILNCYLFEQSVVSVVKYRASGFSGSNDFWTSFLFNLLS